MCQVPTFTGNGATRKLPWIFDKPSAANSKLMTLLLIPMTQSVAFRKLGVGPGCGDDKKKLSHGDQIREACAEKLKTSGLSAVADNSRKRKDLDLEPEATLEHASQKSRRMEATEGIGISEPASQEQQQPQGTQPNNKKNQKAAFTGYSAEEKNKYKTTVESPSDPTECREKTALDEILSALIFKGEQISEASVKRLRQLELPPKKLKSSVQSADTALMSTMGFCMNLFLEFAFTAQVSVNGAQFRTYSALRSELQGVLQSAHSDWAALSESNGQNLDALSLSKMLSDQYINKPVTAVIWDDEEDRVQKRIATVMAVQYAQVALPLRQFIRNSLHLGILLHDFPRACLRRIADKMNGPMELIDCLARVKDCLDEYLPFPWITFAADVADVFSSKQHFVERSDEARPSDTPSVLQPSITTNQTAKQQDKMLKTNTRNIQYYVLPYQLKSLYPPSPHQSVFGQTEF